MTLIELLRRIDDEALVRVVAPVLSRPVSTIPPPVVCRGIDAVEHLRPVSECAAGTIRLLICPNLTVQSYNPEMTFPPPPGSRGSIGSVRQYGP